MWKWFKSLPVSVVLAMVVLLSVYTAMLITAPEITLFLSCLIGTIISAIRLLHYFVHERDN